MSGSTTNLDLISSSQASKEITANALFDAGSPATIYGRRASTTTGLTWGHYGGYISIAGTPTSIANGTVALTGSTTNYVVASRATGVVSTSTTTTNWDSASYIRLYQIVTGASSVTSYTDHRTLLNAETPYGALQYQGTWDADTNTPTLADGAGTKGYYYAVSVAGTTSLDGIASWSVGDWAIFNGTVWQKLEGGITSGEIVAALGYTPQDAAEITAAARTFLDDATVEDAVDTLGGAASTGTGGLVREDAPTITGKVTTNDIRFAAISTTLPTLTFVDACFHLAKDDTDKGAWRKRKGQSWRSEARSAGKYLGVYSSNINAVAGGGIVGDYYYNSTGAVFAELTDLIGGGVYVYRAGREDYPTNALITAEAARVIVWDLDGAVPSMWFVISNTNWVGSVTCVSAVNNIFTYKTSGLIIVDFASDAMRYISITNTVGFKAITQLHATATVPYSFISSAAIVNNTVNDVAITVLPDAPLDEYGMPVPTIFVATDVGVSVINNNGTVADLVDVAGDDTNEVVFDRNNNCYFTNETQGDINMFLASNYDADDTTPDALYDNTTIPALLAAITATKQGLVATKDSIVAGHSTGLSILLPSTAVKANGMVAYATSAYNTGYLVGDIRRAFLSNSKTADRSIKAGTLTEVGTVTETTYSGGRSVYSGFSAANYFQEATHADFNALGTGDFSIIMSGVKWGTAATLKTLLSIGNGATEGSLSFEHLAANTLRLHIWSVTPTKTTICTTTATFTDTAEHTVGIKRSGTTFSIEVDGVVVATGTSALTISNATGYLRVGEGQDASQPWAGGFCSCVRISATAPTAEQSKYIAAQENALNGGKTCLLSNSSTVSALSYDKDTDTYLVGNGTNVDTFQGLKRIASQAHGVTTLTSIASINGRKLIAGTGASYTAPERNISAELLEAQTTKPRTQNYSFTSSGTTWALPKGWKAQGVIFNLTDGTMAAAAQTFDGFLFTLTGLTTAKAHQIQLVEA